MAQEKIDAAGEHGQEVNRAGAAIGDAEKACAAAHRRMLYALFVVIFGERPLAVTWQDLASAGFDDSREPDIVKYFDYF